MNIDLLLRAADFVESNSDHDYCSSNILSASNNHRKQLREKVCHRRGYHNELERRRRADLRDNLELLKDVIPFNIEERRLSTVKLLNEAASYVRRLKKKAGTLNIEIQKLSTELESLENKSNDHVITEDLRDEIEVHETVVID
ncbi:max dimerization protein 3-like [Stegodyphus dumicola]|uniref:max dimerization protein 3-like n=1 Tax=Stegodyphus dumicola TaxID=202533 RepID=UPI0015AF61A7|nr:max dimerization protein 3-like [Stegodyphus dumicola]